MQEGDRNQQPIDDDMQSGRSQEKQQAGDNRGRLSDGDQGQQQADDNQEKQFQGKEKQQQVIALPSQCYDVIFQGDNVDMNVYVRDMRVDKHHFTILNSYAVKDQVACSSRHAPA